MTAPQKRRDAQKFHRISVLLATLIAAAAVAIATGINPPDGLPEITQAHFWLTPLFVLMDSWWGLIPLALGLWIGIRLLLAGYRWIGTLAICSDFEKRRAGHLALYMSAFAPLEALLAGLILIAGQIIGPPTFHIHPIQFILILSLAFAAWLSAGLGTVLLFSAPLQFVRHVGRQKILRGILLILYPPFAATLLGLSLAATSWLAGYLAMAIRSATR